LILGGERSLNGPIARYEKAPGRPERTRSRFASQRVQEENRSGKTHSLASQEIWAGRQRSQERRFEKLSRAKVDKNTLRRLRSRCWAACTKGRVGQGREGPGAEKTKTGWPPKKKPKVCTRGKCVRSTLGDSFDDERAAGYGLLQRTVSA